MSAQYDNSFSSSSNILGDSDDDATAAVQRCSAPEASSLTDRHGKLVDAAASFLGNFDPICLLMWKILTAQGR